MVATYRYPDIGRGGVALKEAGDQGARPDYRRALGPAVANVNGRGRISRCVKLEHHCA